MQTAKIKVGEQYAKKRSGLLVRFHVTEIVTRRTTGGTKNEIRGYIVEERKSGNDIVHSCDPDDLLGPYEEQAELVVRAKQEAEQHEQDKRNKAKQALADRLALYRFVGVEPPKDEKSYHQLFSVSYGSLDFRSDGHKAIIARVHELEKMQLPELKPLPAGELLRIVKGE